MSEYTLLDMRNTIMAAYLSGPVDDRAGITHAGIAMVAADTGNVLLAQRSMDPTDDPSVQQTWEFPGGGMNPDESPWEAAVREFTEETGLVFPAGRVENGWRAPNGVYQGFVYVIPSEFSLDGWSPTDETQALAWVSPDDAASWDTRPEMGDFDWSILAVSGNQSGEGVDMQTEDPADMAEDAADSGVDEAAEGEPDLSSADLVMTSVPIHGVMAPEDTETGDGRGFNPGSITARPVRLPFSWQKHSQPGHDKSVVVGSVDRLMRQGGMIHWEGQLMCTSEEADEFAALLAFFGQFGVSVDGDQGSMDKAKTQATGVVWFDAIRAAGLTAVAIPAFHEAYVAFGPHPSMPAVDSTDAETMTASGDLVVFKRGPGWITDPKATKRIHDYWMPGHPGGDKIMWGKPGDFARAKALIGEKIAANSPTKVRFLNAIIAQWHHDALGYWPATHAKMDRAAAKASGDTETFTQESSLWVDYQDAVNASDSIVATEDEDQVWEAVLTSSAMTQARVYPPSEYFDFHPDSGALVIEDPDANGFRRTYGYAGEWGICHVGIDGRCVEVPRDTDGSFSSFHLGRTRVDEGEYINTGLITYKVDHRSRERMLSETAEQQHFDNVANAWAAVRIGMDERGIWFSGVVLPGIPEDDITLIQAAGQVSGEWKYAALRALQAVNVPGFPVMRSSALYDEEGEIELLVASAFGVLSECAPTPAEMMAALASADAEVRFQKLREEWS